MTRESTTLFKILLVESDPAEVKRISSLLENRTQQPAFRLTCVEGLDQAERACSSARFDAVLVGLPLAGAGELLDPAALFRAAAGVPVLFTNGQVNEAGRIGQARSEENGLAQEIKSAIQQNEARPQQEKSDLFRAVFERSAVGVALVRPDGQFLRVNQYFCDLLGYSQAELQALTVPQITSPEDRSADPLKAEELAARKIESYTVEKLLLNKDGHSIWVNLTVSATDVNSNVDSQGDCYIGVVENISRRKQLEQALRLSEEKYARVFQANPAMIAVSSLQDGRIVEVNHSFEQISGYAREEAVGRTTVELGFWADGQEREQVIQALRTEGHQAGREFSFRTKSGQTRIGLGINELIEVGGETFALSIIEDISERKAAEEALKESEARFRALIENTGDWVWEVDPTMVFNFASPKVEELLGFKREELIGKTPFDLMPPEEVQRIAEEYRKIVAAQLPFTGLQCVSRRKDGSQIVLECSGTPIFGINGEFRGYRGVNRDVTERKQHERELEVIAAVSNALRAAETREEMLPIILGQLVELLKVEGAELVMRDPANGEAQIELANGRLSNLHGKHVPAGRGISGHVIATGQPFQSSDLEHDSYFYEPALRGAAIACVPLIARSETLGAILVIRSKMMNTAEMRLLTSIADIAASAIHRTTLHEQTRRSLHRLGVLHKIDSAITSSLDLQAALEVILEHIVVELGVDAADVLLLNPYTQHLEYASGRGFHPRTSGPDKMRIGEGMGGRAAQQRRLVDAALESFSGNQTVRSLLQEEGFVSGYAVPLLSKGQVSGALEVFHRAQLNPDDEWFDFLDTLAGQAAVAVEDLNLLESLRRSNIELTLAYNDTIEGWSRAMDLRDRETEGHTQRVMEMTMRLARKMGMGEEEIIHIQRGALLHDIGKMGVPDSVLLKPGSLTSEEWEVMRRHPQLAYELLAPIKYLQPALDIPYCHHEKWDGLGYPRGLKGEQIPFAARMFSVVDVWDALRSHRPYRSAWTYEQTTEFIQSMSGTQFDPQVVQVFLEMIVRDHQLEKE